LSAAAAFRPSLPRAGQRARGSADDRNDYLQHETDDAEEQDHRNDEQDGCDGDFKNEYAGKFHDTPPPQMHCQPSITDIAHGRKPVKF
jgi:hypothetical protein